MNFEEYAAKPLLSLGGINIPEGRLVKKSAEAFKAASELGKVVIKAQVPVGKRGKAGGIQMADTGASARAHAESIIGMDIGGFEVNKVLVEQQFNIEREFYAAVLNDPASKGPIILFSTEGGMDIEEITFSRPDRLRKLEVDIRAGIDHTQLFSLIEGLSLDGLENSIADVLFKLFQIYQANDAELIEINPLIVTSDKELVALDCKFVMDDSGIKRQEELAKSGTPEKLSNLEEKGEQNPVGDATHQHEIFYFREEEFASTHTTLPYFLEFFRFLVTRF